MVAEHVFLQHVTLVEGLVAQVTAVFANTWCVILVMLEMNIQLLLFNEQFTATANLFNENKNKFTIFNFKTIM